MFLNKFFHFVKGYVILYLTGFNIERFLYICAKRRIEIRNIEKKEKACATVTVSIDDFFKLRPIAYKTRTKVHIKKKAGLPIILKKYRKRYFMFIGCIIFTAVLFISSQFIWTVEITGIKNADAAKITAALKESGVYKGAFKPFARSSKEIKDILLNRDDNISWAWVYLKGTKAICEVFEGTAPKEALDSGEACDVSAARDGIIKRIIATDGIKMVSAGDTVEKGDILISGGIPDNEGKIACTVAADGIAEARTWHEKTDTYKLYYEYKEPTGRYKKYYSINIFSGTVNLFFDGNIPYENYELSEKKYEMKFRENYYTGISAVCKKAAEVSVVRQPISYDMAVYEGKCDLEERIAKELLPGAELVSENLTDRQIDSETVEVTLTMEFTEDIGTKVPAAQADETDKQE